MRRTYLVTVLLLFTAGTSIAQQITVQLLDGRNGHPLKDQVVDFWFGDRASGHPVQVTTGRNGTAVVAVPRDAQTFVAAGEFVADCRGGNKNGLTFMDSTVYAITAVVSTGVVARNSCGETTQYPIPGTLTFFVRPMHWWEKIRE